MATFQMRLPSALIMIAASAISLPQSSPPPEGGSSGSNPAGTNWQIVIDYIGTDTATCVEWDYATNQPVTVVITKPWDGSGIKINGAPVSPGLYVPAGAWRTCPFEWTPSTISYRSEGKAVVSVKWVGPSPKPMTADFHIVTGASYHSDTLPLRNYTLSTSLSLTPIKTQYSGSIPGQHLERVSLDSLGEGEFEIDLNAFVDSHRHQNESIQANANSINVIKDGRGAIIYGAGAGVAPKSKASTFQHRSYQVIVGGQFAPVYRDWYYNAYDAIDIPTWDLGDNINFSAWEIGIPARRSFPGSIEPYNQQVKLEWMSSNPYITTEPHGTRFISFRSYSDMSILASEKIISNHFDSYVTGPTVYSDSGSSVSNFISIDYGDTNSYSHAILELLYDYPTHSRHKSRRLITLKPEYSPNLDGANSALWAPESEFWYPHPDKDYRTISSIEHGDWNPVGSLINGQATFSDNKSINLLVGSGSILPIVLSVASAFSPVARIAAGLEAASAGSESLIDNLIQTLTQKIGPAFEAGDGVRVQVLGSAADVALFQQNPFAFEWQLRVRQGTWYRVLPIDHWNKSGFVGTQPFLEYHDDAWTSSPREHVFRRPSAFSGSGAP